MGFLVDLACFLVVPLLCWRLVRGAVPMAVLPILAGLSVAIAADRLGFDKALLGPSPLGETIGWCGVLTLAFSAGLETRTASVHLPRLGGQAVASALVALALPFAVGAVIALSGSLDLILARPEGVSPWLSAGAIGLCLAVSALPVLVGIVRELPAEDRPLGNLSLRIAALDDAILWAGLALLLFFHNGESGGLAPDGWAPLVACGLLALMSALRDRVDRLLPAHVVPSALIGLAYLAAGSWATSTLGLHELLGAYFAGAMVPARLADRLMPERLGKFALFGPSPLFFAHRGLSIDGALITPAALAAAVALLLLAGTAKLGAVHLVPPSPGMAARERTQLGLLLQCKGLMEIVAATILVQAGLITSTVFAVLVTLALVSTTLTVPLFRLASRIARTRRAAA